MKPKTTAKKTAAAPDPLDEVTRDLAKKIQEKAEERAQRRSEDVMQRIIEIIRLAYPSIQDPDKRLAILREIISGTVGKELIFAEISRMNSSIAFLASTAETPSAE